MNPDLNAARIGLSRGWIEFLATFRNPQELLFGYLFFPAIFLAMALFFLDGDMDGGISVGAVHMAAGIALIIAILGVMSVAQVLATEREDGTLLRSRAVPHGMIEYTVGKIVHVLLVSLLSLTLMVIPAVLFVDGFTLAGPVALITLVWVCLLGLLALAPIGAILGALLSNPKTGVGLAMLPIMAILLISGIYFPLEYIPAWLQTIAMVFPVYWIGAGLRAAVFSEELLASGPFEAVQLPLVAGVLLLWAGLGFLLAQKVLRRMARRQSGSRVQAAQEEAMKRGY